MTKCFFSLALICAAFTLSSCKKDNDDLAVKPYTVPSTYSFSTVNDVKASQRVKMAVELDAYLKLANAGSTTVPLDQTKVNNMFNNTGSPFADASLNTSGISLREVTEDADWLKSFADSVLLFNNGVTASEGTGGFVPRSANKIIVGNRGLEYGQAFIKGIMGGLFFKEAIDLLTSIRSIPARDTLAAQAKWDEVYGYLGVPDNYDSSLVYENTNPDRPLLWGGYLRERGRGIQAGGIIFGALLKGRAAIGGFDVNVRDAQIDVIVGKWEQLAAAAALNYVTAPTASASIGNYGSQLHGLSEGYGFIAALKYRAPISRLTEANYQTLKNIMSKDFYVLLNQPGFTDLVTAQNILKTTYDLP